MAAARPVPASAGPPADDPTGGLRRRVRLQPAALPVEAPAAGRSLRVGLLGGSFNPAHDGHRYISLEALRRLGLDQVWWLVSPQNPLKPVAGMAPLAERVAAASAVARHPRIRVTALEARLGTRYTVDTLRRLLRWPAHRFVWLLGADNLAQLPRWRHWTEIIGRSGVAVFERLPYSYPALRGAAATRFSDARIAAERAHELAELAAPAWVFLRLRPHRASSTVIRGVASRRRQRGQDGEPDDHGTA